MERLNWIVLSLLGVVTALGLTTSSGAGKTKTDSVDGEVKFAQVVECSPISGDTAASHAGCSACQAKKDATANDTAKPATAKPEFDSLIALMGKGLSGKWESNAACPDSCQAGGVCCDKSSNKEIQSIAASFDVPDSQVKRITTAPLIQDLDKPVCNGDCPLSKKTATDVAADCPLTKAADAITNLTKNFVCEGGNCPHGTLTITAVDPAAKSDVTAKPEGLLNLVAAGEVAATAQSDPGPITSTITISSDDLTKAGTGTLTLNVKASDAKPAIAVVPETKAADAKPVIDNSHAAARAAKLAKLEAKMAQPWTLAFNETPLTQAAAAVQAKFGVPVLIDQRGLEEIAFDSATPLTADQQPEIEAGEFLRGYLRNHGLTWMIPASNDRIVITSIGGAMEAQPINRVYDVTDLIDENHGADGIIERIQSLVEPQSWKAAGGNGDLTVWQKGNRVSLICSNTYWTQRAIAVLLEDLRLNTGDAGEQATLGAPRDAAAVLRRYELPALLDVKDRTARQKLLLSQKQFFLTLLKDEPGFDPAVFETIEFADQSLLLTKQAPAVHRQIQKTLKMLESPVGGLGGFSSTHVSQY